MVKYYLAILAAVLALAVGGLADAQAVNCIGVALKATPPGPFPCSVNLDWLDNSTNETGFVVERQLNGGAWAALATGQVGSNVTHYVDLTVAQSTTVDNVYAWRVRAANSAGQSVPSNAVTLTVPMSVTPPNPPTGLTITFENATGEMRLSNRTIRLRDQSGSLAITAAGITVVEIP